MGFIKPSSGSEEGGGNLTPQQESRLNNAYSHAKSSHAPSNAEQNVQSDWNETDENSDAYIKNKPTNLATTDQIPTVPTKTSQLTNDSNFVTTIEMTEAINNASLGGGEVDTSGYVTKETGNANQITFSDGQTFQAKLNAGLLKGDKGDKGEDGYTPIKGVDYFDGAKGDKGDKGQDGLTTQVSVNGETYTHTNGLITLPNYPIVPTKTSQLTNDSGYATESYVTNKIAEASLSGGEVDLSGYATKDELPTRTSDLTNDSGFITSSDVHVHTNKAVLDDISSVEVNSWNTAYTHSQSSHFSGNYNDLTNKPTIPSEYTHPSTHPASMVTGLASVATSGSYNDLTDTPSIPSVDGLASTTYVDNKVADIVNSAPESLDTLQELANALGNDPNFATTLSNQIGNKVDKVTGKGLSTNDLTNTLKANYDSAHTHSQSAHAPSNAQKNSDITKAEIEAKLTGNITTHAHSQYLTEHQSLDGYAKTTDIPTKTSDLTNDSDYTTKTYVDDSIYNINNNKLHGYSFYPLTRAMYEALSDAEKNADDVIYIITDEELDGQLHNHNNKAILDTITQEKIDVWDMSLQFKILSSEDANITE